MAIGFLDFSGQTTSEKRCFVLFCAGLDSLNVDCTDHKHTKSAEFAGISLSEKVKTPLEGKLLVRSGWRLDFWISQAKLRQKNTVSCSF
ncbi:hypothetical protein NL487_26025, partial [Klebsiella pneumoniae]|nr:hypothetical protein [Klebsiella pneumoniae]